MIYSYCSNIIAQLFFKLIPVDKKYLLQLFSNTSFVLLCYTLYIHASTVLLAEMEYFTLQSAFLCGLGT